MKKRFPLSVCCVVVACALSGCYSYKSPPHAIDSNDYTTLVADETLRLPDGCDTLTLDLAQRIAQKNNPDYIATQHSMAAAWAVFYRSLSNYLPNASGTYSIGRTNQRISSYQGPAFTNTFAHKTYTDTQSLGAQSTYLLFDGLRRTMNMLADYHFAKQAEYIKNGRLRLLTRSVALAYNEVLLSMEQMRIASSDLAFNRSMLEESTIKYEAGAVALTDVLNYQIKATEAQNYLIIATYAHRSAKYALAKLLGLTSASIPEHVKFPELKSVKYQLLTDLNFYLDTALERRSDLKSYREALKVSEYDLYRSWGAFSPSVYFNTGGDYNWERNQYRNMPWGGRSFTENQRGDDFGYGVSAEWVLFQGGRRFFAVREQQALVAQSEYLLLEKWLTVINEVRQSYDACHKSAKQLRLFKSIQHDSLKNRDLVQEEYQAGNTSITRLNQAQNYLIQAEANLASARVNVLNSQAQLQAAINQVYEFTRLEDE